MSNIEKGGAGSGVKGHQTAVQALNEKLKGPATPNPFADHLKKLKTGAVWEGKKLSTGKPVFTQMEHAQAHGYTPGEHREAGNLHYEHAQKMADRVAQIKTRGKDVPKEMDHIVEHHNKAHKRHFAAAEKLDERQKSVEQAVADKKVKKSIVGMGYIDAPEVDTAKFAVESDLAEKHPISRRLRDLMEGFTFGDVPRSLLIDAGTLHMAKVDDGLYSGYLVKEELVDPLDGSTPQMMSDSAKVRLERMTIPTLVNFLLAKESVMPDIAEAAKPEAIISLNESLSKPLEEPLPMPLPSVQNDLDRRITILQLIDKLVN